MLLMALDGRFGDVPDYAVFADTRWEPKAVYEWLDKLEALVAPFPIVRIDGGDIRAEAAGRGRLGGRYASMPLHLTGGAMGRRQCTKEYKIAPMQRYWRSLGATAKNPVECWIGISTDEAHRMKPSQRRYAVNRWPLIEANLSRVACEAFLRERVGFIPTKSSCIGCPYHGDRYWLKLRAESPDEFGDAVEFDKAIRVSHKMRADQFLHRSLRPLDQVDFLHETQGAMFEDAFGNECEGLCGT